MLWKTKLDRTERKIVFIAILILLSSIFFFFNQMIMRGGALLLLTSLFSIVFFWEFFDKMLLGKKTWQKFVQTLFKNKDINSIKGFSLVELMVVISIISIMSVGVVVGMSSFKDSLAPGNALKVIKNEIKYAEQSIIRNDYEKVIISFLGKHNYLVVVAEPINSTLDLKLSTDGKLTTTDSGELKKSNESGGIEMISLDSDASINVDFTNTDDNEWKYQLVNENGVSPVIRFVRFAKDKTAPVFFVKDTNSKIIIESPNAKKSFYEDGDKKNELKLTLIDSNNDETNLILR